MRSLPLTLTLALFLGLLPGALHTQEWIFLEADPGVTEVKPCDYLHFETCNRQHVSAITLSSEGTLLELESGQYLVEWSGPGYYLDSGMIVQPVGETKSALKGQRWLEVFPKKGRLHTSIAWKDFDHDDLLSPSDQLILDSGRELTVKDRRLHLRVRPVPGGRPASGSELAPERQ
ncbi:MAG TPA: hypothetical protein VF789_31535 [Thermoanaerobaculia bacterium]